ncbi:hypothetical protein W97_08244 [Coniosporium apollinis CBS 100218]|uniref:Uncharacterized protein n=1 Tax=Coniosporium apollinis (strain CBS 100218) TaxID=1168221 RepID=R7Z4X4_CONA1|nr:uncharacterized protein W97_08244 [Coniosporium apollinis CBS 100218]EON68986.1 hypothetical protein W97_08244 [Coniosporium apollinis CBS 100218]
MPKYFAANTEVRLSVASLADTTTVDPELRKSSAATGNAETADRLLKAGKRLYEQPVVPSEDDGLLGFLGEHQDIPFFMVHASVDILEPAPTRSFYRGDNSGRLQLRPLEEPSGPQLRSPLSASSLTDLPSTPCLPDEEDWLETQLNASQGTRGKQRRMESSPTRAATTRSAASHRNFAPKTTNAELGLQALSVQVKLSSKSFLRSFDERNVAQDVKMDVFFNGDLIASTFVPARYKSEIKHFTELHQQFSGKKIHNLLERVLVLVPLGQNADGSLRSLKRGKAASAGAAERWHQISTILEEEAEKQGFNQYGDRSPVGEYLASLAALPMPEAVQGLQKPGGLKFGVIDVILTAGKGKKYGPSTRYLSGPERLVDDRYLIKTRETFKKEVVETRKDASVIDLASQQPEASAQLQQSVVFSSPVDTRLQRERNWASSNSTRGGLKSPMQVVAASPRSVAALVEASPRGTSSFPASQKTFSTPMLHRATASPGTPTPLPVASTKPSIAGHYSLKNLNSLMTSSQPSMSNTFFDPVQPFMPPPRTPDKSDSINGTKRRRRSSWLAPENLSPLAKKQRVLSDSMVEGADSGYKTVPKFFASIGRSQRPQIPVLRRPFLYPRRGSVGDIPFRLTTSSPSPFHQIPDVPPKSLDVFGGPILKRVVVKLKDTTVLDHTFSELKQLKKPPFKGVEMGTRRHSIAAPIFTQQQSKRTPVRPLRFEDSPTGSTKSTVTVTPQQLKFDAIKAPAASTPLLPASSAESTNIQDTKPASRRRRSAIQKANPGTAPPQPLATPITPALAPTPAPTTKPRTRRQPKTHNQPKPRPASQQKAGSQPRRRASAIRTPARARTEAEAEFVVPPLSQDCVVTYAQPGAWSGSCVRQVRSERGGDFREESVIMGVRFLLG